MSSKGNLPCNSVELRKFSISFNKFGIKYLECYLLAIACRCEYCCGLSEIN